MPADLVFESWNWHSGHKLKRGGNNYLPALEKRSRWPASQISFARLARHRLAKGAFKNFASSFCCKVLGPQMHLPQESWQKIIKTDSFRFLPGKEFGWLAARESWPAFDATPSKNREERAVFVQVVALQLPLSAQVKEGVSN